MYKNRMSLSQNIDNIIKLNYEYILSYKNIIDKTNSNLDELFESINSSFISSSNKNDKYKNIKIINSTKKSTNKWKSSLSNSDNILIKIKNIMNKISENNFEKLTNELLMEINISDYLSLLILSNELFNRVITHPAYINIYIKLIIKVLYVSHNKWNFDNKNLIHLLLNMTQRKFYDDFKKDHLNEIDKIFDETFLYNITKIELEGLNNDEIIIKNKSMTLSNVKFIVKLYQVNLLKKNDFNEMLNIITTASDKQNIESLIEILSLFDYDDAIISKKKHVLYKILKLKNLDFRLKFIYEEALKKYFSKTSDKTFIEKEKEKDVSKKNDKFFSIGCQNIIEEYLSIQEFEEITLYLEKSQKNHYEMTCFAEELFVKIICSRDNEFDILKKMLKKLMKKKILRTTHIKKAKKYIDKNIDDLSIDYPNCNDKLDKLNKFITM
jgi:hypothetical protein